MVYGGVQKPGITTGARPHGPRRRPGTGLGVRRFAGRRSFGVCGLAVLALWGAWSLGVIGCSGPGLGYSPITESSGSLFTNMRQSPEDISRLERNAHYYTLMGQPELGLKEMELAHQQDPENLQITDLLAQNYEELGKFEAARQLYQEALTRHGPHAVLANNLCFSYYREGRWQEAEKCFRQTLDRDPGNVSARNNLGLTYCRLGRQDEARRLWQDAEGVAAADAKIGQALAVLGMAESAVYARGPEPTPPAAKVAQAPAPKTAVSRLPAPTPARSETSAPPVAPKEAAVHVASKPPAPTPAPVEASPPSETRKPAVVAPKVLVKEAPAPVVPQAEPQPRPAPLTAMEESTVYAHEPTPPAAKITQAPAPKTAVSRLPAPAPARSETSAPPVAPKEAAIHVAAKPPAPAPLVTRAPQPRPAPLTVAELVDTAIEVRNGTWTKDLARQTRSRLHQEGFTVATIGNHIDFGAAQTVIYYRPEAEKVARAVGATVFPRAGLEPSLKLKKGTDIKILLGADLHQRPQIMARLVGGDN